MPGIRVTTLTDDGLFEVHEGDRWWTVSIATDREPLITSDNDRIISPAGRQGRKLLAAIKNRS
ncbi:hypothetical protein [Gordonia sihwensis]|uniref:hypothetical protein n=1 Tax=Gordonia sihwensis TaxID=173559 RepID=UPI003D96CEBA